MGKILKHIVMWKLRDEAEGLSKCENLVLLKQKLENLTSVIPQIKKLEVGVNINDKGYDAVLYSEFADEKDLSEYQNNPAHKEISEWCSLIRNDRIVVDYFVDS